MKIDLTKLGYTFSKKPLVVGGMAMEFYGLRKSGDDIDLIADKTDVLELIKKYPDSVKDLWGDIGVCPFEFEIWKSIHTYDYDFLKEGATELENCLVISLEKLLFMKAMVIDIPKYFDDVKLIVAKINENEKAEVLNRKKENREWLNGIGNINYIEKSGPEV